ncbi:MAG: YciI family protein [Usitatibacter sp.]
MKYSCLIYIDDKKMEALPASELARLEKESIEYGAVLSKKGHCLLAAALKPVETATTVRLKNARPTVADGPFAETREQLGGFMFIEAADLDDAIAVASKIPALRLGCVEIRAAREMKPGTKGQP